MKTPIKNRQHTPGIAKAVSNALKMVALTFCVSLSLLSAPGFASNSAQLSTLNSQITNLEKSITQDEQAIKQLERSIWGLDAKILEAQKQVRKERDQRRAEYHDIKRDVKRQGFEIEGIKKSISLIDQDIELVQRDSQRSQEYFNSLNPLKRKLEETSHLEKLAENQAKVEALLEEKQALIESLNAATTKHKLLEEKLKIVEASLEETALEDDTRFANLLKEREQAGNKITRMRNQIKQDKSNIALLKRKASDLKKRIARSKNKANQKVATKTKAAPEKKASTKKPAPATNKAPAYVFVISGDQEPNIEDKLKLKDWVESYGAKYIQARWNGFDTTAQSTSQGTETFKQQFAKMLDKIEKNAKIILIGHGRGGGAAIEAATEVAFNANRTIEFLAAIDPIGDENLRANIVYNTTVNCNKPIVDDQISNTEYLTCLRESKKRLITANVKHFYNRWQKDGKGPEDFYRRIKAIDDNGEDIEIPTATGRFATAESILADQKRVFIGDPDKAHEEILSEEARNLPRLLVKHLR